MKMSHVTGEMAEAYDRKIEISGSEGMKLDRAYACLRDALRMGNPHETAKCLGKALANVHKARKKLISEYNHIETHHRRLE